MSIVSTLYLSTDSTSTPLIKSTSNKDSWLIDWDMIFKGRTGLAKVTVNMVSQTGVLPNEWNDGVGIISANFSSPYSINTNGVALTNLNRQQYVEITGDAIAGYETAYVYYYYANNTNATSAPVVNIPTGKSEFSIIISDMTGAQIPLFPEYNIFFYFEWLTNSDVKESINNI